MCISPRRLKTGVLTACHECWQCREHAILDWTGRNIAESKTAKAAHALTLTYGRNQANDEHHERSVILTYSDVQKYLKLLRRHDYGVRYFVTGEFGSLKGRAHWHIIMYWQDQVPEHVLDKNFMERHWPHGWSFWTKARPNTVRYNCKYILKDWTDFQSQVELRSSKKPPLGYEFFQKRALQYVEQGLAPQDLFYTFPEAKQRNRQGGHDFMKFMLRDRSAELFLQGYIDLWARERGNKPRPKSELVDRFEKFGRVVSDSLLETLVDEDWAYRDRRAKQEADQTKAFRPWDDDLWWFHFIRQAPNEQERQRREIERDIVQPIRRQEQFEQRLERLRREQPEEYAKYLRACGEGPGPSGECASGSLGRSQPDQRRHALVDQYGKRLQSGASSGHVPSDALGPIGTYNRDYAAPDIDTEAC